MNILENKMNADEFLQSMETKGTATVSVVELRKLLQTKREQDRLIAKLKYDNELLQLRNVALKQEVTELKYNQLRVTNIDITC